MLRCGGFETGDGRLGGADKFGDLGLGQTRFRPGSQNLVQKSEPIVQGVVSFLDAGFGKRLFPELLESARLCFTSFNRDRAIVSSLVGVLAVFLMNW